MIFPFALPGKVSGHLHRDLEARQALAVILVDQEFVVREGLAGEEQVAKGGRGVEDIGHMENLEMVSSVRNRGGA